MTDASDSRNKEAFVSVLYLRGQIVFYTNLQFSVEVAKIA